MFEAGAALLRKGPMAGFQFHEVQVNIPEGRTRRNGRNGGMMVNKYSYYKGIYPKHMNHI